MSNAKVQALLTDLQKQFGENKVMMASNIPVGPPTPTGSYGLDFATGYGGFPSNRVVEICGREGTGKTTLGLTTMLNALEMCPDRGALLLDVEHKITPDWLEMIVGKELLQERVIYIQPTSIEQATNVYRKAVESGQVCMAMLDSIGGAPTVRRNDDAEVGHYGGNAIGVGEFARSAATLSAAYDCLTIGINQTRVAINSPFPVLNTPGGNAWKHAVILRVELVRGKETETATIDTEKVPIGYNIWAKIRKNQVGAPGRAASYWFYNIWTEEHGFGIDSVDEAVRLSIKTGTVVKDGGWYKHPALPKGKVQGLPAYMETVKKDKALEATIVSEVLASLADHAGAVAPMGDPEASEKEISGMESIYLEGGQ